uniref:Regulating synaptic membrane exocytosis 1a n=1 Tax=Oryzias sinensis TaxID=183150 RepID=A0A8C7YGF2_9TELE
MLRNDSLSSDQSESLRPPPPRPYKSKRGVGAGGKRQTSVSSSEEEGVTTPEYSSGDDAEIESVSERGDWESYPHDPTVWHHPVTWQPSKEGDHLIGRITLSKRSATMPKEAGALLGLKVVGGRVTESGRLGAFITKVKKGSLADVVGHLRAGDEVLQWNGKMLPGATMKEVYNIILESQAEPQVELVVSRPIGDIPRIPDTSHPPLESSSSSFESQKMERPSLNVLSPSSPGMLQDAPQFMPGRLSVKLWYDKAGHQLIVNVLQAVELPLRPDGRPRSPYVKMYFLPDRSDKSKRRTKAVKKTCEPRWNQTFVYTHVHRRDFRNHMLELTVWDQPRSPEEDSTFMGEILIELETALLDDKPHWYPLQTHDVSSIPLPRPSPFLPRRHPQSDAPGKKLQRSQRVTEPEFDERAAVLYKGRGRERQRESSSTLEVPEQQRTPSHHIRSRSVSPRREEQGRNRSRAPNVPTQRSGMTIFFFCCLRSFSLSQRGTSLSTSVTSSSARRVRQLPQLPPQSSTVEQGIFKFIFNTRTLQTGLRWCLSCMFSPPSNPLLPAPYVKVYLLDNGTCKAKKKTKIARKTLEPLYQQHLLFDESPQGKVLQVIVWGDYGRLDHKCFMGVAQILLEELDLSSTVIGWYKLFPTSSLVDPTLAPLTRLASQTSLDSSGPPPGVRS